MLLKVVGVVGQGLLNFLQCRCDATGLGEKASPPLKHIKRICLPQDSKLDQDSSEEMMIPLLNPGLSNFWLDVRNGTPLGKDAVDHTKIVCDGSLPEAVDGNHW